MGWYQDLITSKVFSINSWVSDKLQLLNHSLLSSDMAIFVTLMVNERRLKVEVQLLCIIVLVHSCANCANIIVDINSRVYLRVQILYHNLWFAITLAIQSDEILKWIYFSKDKIVFGALGI